MRRSTLWLLMALSLAPGLLAQETIITAELMGRHIGVLAHDSMRGRGTPSREIELTADYVEQVFRRLGLRPAGENGSFRQRFPVPARGSGTPGTGPNVIAVLPGSDPALAAEYVAVVAHMDHVGVGRPLGGDSIYNGADDNASGTAGLLAIAEAAAGLRPAPRRSMLLLAVSGEERGLLGSRYYAEHPTVPLERVVALVNLDMISRNRPDSVYLNGWGKSEVSDLVRRLAAERTDLGLAVGPDLEDRPVTPADSDHYPFQRRGIPYIFFYSGGHPDYHRPGDHPDRVDADKAARIARLALATMLELASAPSRPAWEPEARRLNVAEP
jgi:Zn-dependent M28 family amino/carboxypeptidase